MDASIRIPTTVYNIVASEVANIMAEYRANTISASQAARFLDDLGKRSTYAVLMILEYREDFHGEPNPVRDCE